MNDIFISICKENSYNDTVNFYNNNTNLIIDNEIFEIFCYNGNLELMKWALKINPNIDVTINNGKNFHTLCKQGHFRAFKWLYVVYYHDGKINDLYLLFINACQGGNIMLIKYIYSLFHTRISNRIEDIYNFILTSNNAEVQDVVLDLLEL